MLRVGVISEGPSDHLVLCAVMKQIRPDAEFVALQPDEALPNLGRGWRGVKAWCERYGSELETLLTQLPDQPLHLLVVQVDCSMADKVEAARPCPPCADTADALAMVIDETWFGRSLRPSFVVLVLPSMTTDTWVVATLDPPFANLVNIECDRAAEDQLTRPIWGSIKRLSWKGGEVKKRSRAYSPFADLVGANLPLVLERCPQARAFHDDFLRAAAIVSPRPGL